MRLCRVWERVRRSKVENASGSSYDSAGDVNGRTREHDICARDSLIVPLCQRQGRQACDEDRVDARDEQGVSVEPRELLYGPPYAGNDSTHEASFRIGLGALLLSLSPRLGVDLYHVDHFGIIYGAERTSSPGREDRPFHLRRGERL